jgi:diguanylate cyclase (GGDEF)-like protein
VSSQKTIKLLVVDDDEDDIYLILDALNEVNGTRYNVTTASSALAAMSELAKGSFDVIFSDYRLGVATGIDFINHVRAARIDTPVILLTGIADQVIDEAALVAGASDFVPKTSINPDVLDRSVRYALAHADRHKLLQTVLSSTISGVVVLDKDGQISLWNPRFLEFAQAAFGEDAKRFEKTIELTLRSLEKDIRVGERIVEAHTTPLPDGGSVLALHDVTQRATDLKNRELAEQQIRRVAMQDALTGLPNRMAFNDYLDACLERASAKKTSVALLIFDFNRFKEVNDFFGHAAGDQLLKMTAARLGIMLAEGEYAARLGGDEFVLVQENATQETAIDLAQRIVANLSVPLEWEIKMIEASVSVGVALYPDQGDNRRDLLANADLAMYRGKAEVGRPVCVYDASMDHFVREQRKVAHDLRSALPNNELSLHFQPQFNSASGMLTGFEALLRWHSPSWGLISPAVFIPIAEETGLINEIDEWVLRRACKAMVEWPLVPRIAVNISAKAICQTGIISSVKSILMETGLSPSRLELEVTETALIHDLNRALHNLRQLKAIGISIAMDDFGTGYSSLSLLNSFPFDRIKIDKSFIELAGSNVRADAIFHTVISLGAALHVPVLVEGVETSEQFRFASTSGCEEVQGFHFGKPISADSMDNLFAHIGTRFDMAGFDSWQKTVGGKVNQLLLADAS